MTDKRLYYICFPKTGGSTIRRVLSPSVVQDMCLDTKCPGKFHPSHTSLVNCGCDIEENISIGSCNTIKPQKPGIYIFGHHCFPFPKTNTDFVITSIRNPLSWYVSRWSYHISVSNTPFWGKDATDISAFHRWIKTHAGLYTQRFLLLCYQKGGCIIDYFIRLENLTEDLKNIPVKLNLKLNNIPHHNMTKHLNYNMYYTEKLEKLVRLRDKIIFDMFYG